CGIRPQRSSLRIPTAFLLPGALLAPTTPAERALCAASRCRAQRPHRGRGREHSVLTAASRSGAESVTPLKVLWERCVRFQGVRPPDACLLKEERAETTPDRAQCTPPPAVRRSARRRRSRTVGGAGQSPPALHGPGGRRACAAHR